MDSLYHVQINMSVKRDIIWDTSVRNIHKREVLIYFVVCIKMSINIVEVYEMYKMGGG